jgi:biotin transport system substrate-specific component
VTPTTLRHPALADALVAPSLARNVLLALAGTLALAISAKVQVPFWPVPMTMQTFVVLLIGAAYGWRLGAATVLFYLAQGAAGLPVFAAGGGIAYLAGPTGGFLAGFVLAAAAVGFLAERGFDRRAGTTVLAMLAGMAVIYACGVAWLATLTGLQTAVAKGMVPFLLADAVKIALAAAVLPLAWRAVGRRRTG